MYRRHQVLTFLLARSFPFLFFVLGFLEVLGFGCVHFVQYGRSDLHYIGSCPEVTIHSCKLTLSWKHLRFE